MTVRRIVSFFTFSICFFFLVPFFAFASHIPAPTGFINDFAGILTSDQKIILEQQLKEYEAKTGNEITIAIVKNLNGLDIDDFAVKTFEEWKIGKKGKDNGILFLTAVEDRKMRIEVGYGLEPYLTDSQAGDIIRNVIAPRFQKQDYYQGISDGIIAIEQKLSTQNNTPKKDSRNTFEGIKLFIYLSIFFFTYISSFLARSKSFWAGGVIGAFVGVIFGMLLFSLFVGMVFAAIFGLMGLLLDWWLSRVYKERTTHGYSTGWWTSGGGFRPGGRFPGGGFGGFGGGRSGGGGASGSW